MRVIRSVCFLTIFLGVSLTVNTPAFAISQEKWTSVCINFLGLRSAATQVDTNGAGYGMDDGNTAPLNCVRAAPDGWDATLTSTIDLIKGFANSGTQYLLIVGGCPGLARDYPGAFPKQQSVRRGDRGDTEHVVALHGSPIDRVDYGEHSVTRTARRETSLTAARRNPPPIDRASVRPNPSPSSC